MKKHILALSLALAFFGTAAANAEAAGPSPVGVRMPAKSFSALKSDIARARTVDAKSFAVVSSIVTHAADDNAKARGGRAATAHSLAQLGPSALLPILEMLAVDAPKGMSDAEGAIVRRDLIEAVGILRDPKALPVLVPILEDASEEIATTRSASEAIARIGTEESADRLLGALSASSGERTRAILSGMGDCRHLRVTEALASHIRASNDDLMVKTIAHSLGRSGNAWAWKTLADRSEEATIRKTAAAALVDAFVKNGGEGRQAASNALMVVDAPETPSLIASARQGASADVAKALDDLAARFARNPSRSN